MSPEVYAVYLGVLAAFFLGPPDSTELLTVSNTLRHGRRRAVFTIMGDLSANVLQMTVAAFGLAALIASSASAVTTVKWLGVAYLAYLGLRMLLSRGADALGETGAGAVTGAALFRQGFVTALANLWAVIFFAALFPQFIDPAAPVLPQLVLLGVTYLAIDAAQLFAYSALTEAAKARLGWLRGQVMARLSGVLMLAAAALLAAKDFSGMKETG